MKTCPNTSPLVVLGKLDRLDLLGDPAGLVLTEAVLAEVRDKQDEATARVDALASRAVTVRSAEAPAVDPLRSLGAGERSVLAWALGSPADAICILDDRAARAEARRLGIRFTGTLGVILRAKIDGRIVSAAPLLEQARAAGLRISPDIIATALARIGETSTGRSG